MPTPRLDPAGRAAALAAQRTPFVSALVVRAQRPASVRPGDAAIVLADGTIEGFVGGDCAEASVRLHAARVLETGEPLLLRILPGDGEAPASEGAVTVQNPCLSGGALEIFLEPRLPAPLLVVVGDSPVARAVAELAAGLGYEVEARAPSGQGRRAVAGPEGAPDDDGAVGACPGAPGDDGAFRAGAGAPRDDRTIGAGAAAVVVASHGRGKREALSAALLARVPYVGLVASRVRGDGVREALRAEGVGPERIAALRSPAGLDIGARGPREIALAIMAEIVARRESGLAAPGLPVGGRRLYFCGERCRAAFRSDPAAV